MQFQVGALKVEINDQGSITHLLLGEEDYLANVESPLIRVCQGEQTYSPNEASFDGNIITMNYGLANVVLKVQVIQCNDYITLEVIEVIGGQVDTIIWGPYPTTINETIGEIVGVVRNQKWGFGIQTLNVKTLAGWPVECPSVFDEKEGSTLFNISVCGFKYPDLIAVPTSFGSVIQAYCRDRTKDRKGRVWGKENVHIEGFQEDDAKIKGSKIALFGCDTESILEKIGEIEVKEGLPHPTIEGEWIKTSRKSMMSYLITDFKTSNIDEILEVAERGEFEYVYHPDPFATWGHFKLREDHFEKGDESLSYCAKQAAEKNIGLGLHTLTTFTTTNDDYITPIPDTRLAKVQTTIITEDIDAEQDIIAIEDGLNFEEVDDLGAVCIGDELIQYEYTDEVEGKFCLMACTRGAFETRADGHKQGEKIHKLWDHGYKVLFPNLELQDKYIERLVSLYNHVGIRQISFDGLEGCLSTGHEEYSINRMVNGCYEGWDHEVINDSSRLHHFLWHIHTRTNWGEPWGATMREGQIDLRLMNQDFYRRNLFPRMLGWFLVRLQERQFEATTPDDIEWMLSKAAGFDAGFSVCMDYKVIKNHGYTLKYMDLIKEWERARRVDAFTAEQKKKLLIQHSEWHLEKVDTDEWSLHPVDLSKAYICDPEQLQPGQPGGADWGYTNPYEEQILRFRLRAVSTEKECDGVIENPGFVIDNKRYKFKGVIGAGQYLVYEGGLEGIICDQNFNTLSKAKLLSKTEMKVATGTQPIAFTAEFKGETKPYAEVKFIAQGLGESVKKKIFI